MKEYIVKLDPDEMDILEEFNLDFMFPDYTIEDAIVKGILKQILERNFYISEENCPITEP